MVEVQKLFNKVKLLPPYNRNRDLIKKIKNSVIPLLEKSTEQLDVLFEKPLLFNPKLLYKKSIDTALLQVLVMTLWAPLPRYGKSDQIDIFSLTEFERRELFEKSIQEIELRRLTYDELSNLFAALKFPRPKRSQFKKNYHFEISRIVKEIRNRMET